MHREAQPPSPLQVLSALASPASFFQDNQGVEHAALSRATLHERARLQAGTSSVGWHVHNTRVFAIPLGAGEDVTPPAAVSSSELTASQMEELRRLVEQARVVLAHWDHSSLEYKKAVLPVADLLRSKLLNGWEEDRDSSNKGSYYMYVTRHLRRQRAREEDEGGYDNTGWWTWGIVMLFFVVLFFIILFCGWGRGGEGHSDRSGGRSDGGGAGTGRGHSSSRGSSSVAANSYMQFM